MIKLIIEEHYSKPDVYGNRYWYTKFIDATDQTIFLQYSDNTNNAKSYARQAGFEWDEIYANETSHPIREFNRLYKGLVYMGADDIVSRLKALKRTKEAA